MRYFTLIVTLFCNIILQAQDSNPYEKYPVFEACTTVEIAELPACFETQVQYQFSNLFKMPEIVIKDNYKGRMSILFEVTAEGKFELIYTKAPYSDIKDEVKNVFSQFPVIEPATYDGKPVYTQYTLQVLLPTLE